MKINNAFKDRIIKTDDLLLFDVKEGANFKKIVSRKITLFLRAIISTGVSIAERYKKTVGYSHEYHPYYIGEWDIYYDSIKITEDREKMVKANSKDKDSLSRFANNCERDGNKVMEFTFDIREKDFSKFSLEELRYWLGEGCRSLLDFDTYLMLPFAMQKYFEDSIHKELKKYSFDKEAYTKYFNILTTPNKKNTGFYEQENIIKLAIEYKKKGLTKDLKKKIEKHAFRFGILGRKYGTGAAWTANDVLKRIKFLAESEPEEKLKILLDYDKNMQEAAKKALDDLKASKEFRQLVHLARTYVYIRTFRTDVISGGYANLIPLLSEIAKRKGLTCDQINYCFPDEVIDDRIPSKQVLEKRKNLVFTCQSGKIYYVDGEDARKIIEKFDSLFGVKEEEKAVTKEITGTIANKGVIKGTVKVVKENSELGKVKKGDILVAYMTTPDFVPAMERAAGFITDEGGILCHAAIVSREMKKPCIIGTKIATQVLKDGDVVELDANKGVVRRLK